LSHDIDYKNKLIRYNVEDLIALETIKQWLGSLETEIDHENNNNFAKVDDIKIERTYSYHFGDTDYVLTDYAAVNKYAYFDYQRNKVYLKTNKHVKRATLNRSQKTCNNIDKIVNIFPKECPKCQYSEFNNIHKSKRTIIDLKFMKNGIKKWIIQEKGGMFQCKGCGNLFIPVEYQRHRRFKHGHNIMSWAMNQHMSYNVSFKKINDVLLESFNIKISQGALYRFQSIIAQKYEETIEEIKQNIICGKLCHADETQVTVKSLSSGYVWAFTNMLSVFYLFKPTRESDFLKDLFNEFHGVLVSDFYTGYDSLPCPQQKCLVHLIRDLNEDILNHQFDTEFTGIAKSFGRLLRTIVETINTYGLKKRHLNKHHKDVDLFYYYLNKDYFSDVVLKYQKRLNKYKEKIFAFLDYDGVPWNNNNAEHAIKPFAIYRDNISATFSLNGINDYLTILSIQQTCKYRGISFLDFLKSGNKSIDNYSKY
jgi:hypothetical protein